MVILDFYGMPGSGKSTISHMLAERLREDGYMVIEPSWTLDNKDLTWKRLCKKMLLAISYEICNPFVVMRAIAYAGKENSLKQKIKLWVNLAYTMNYETRQKGADYMIMDEGIVQGVVSLFSETEGTQVRVCTEYLHKKLDGKIRFIYVKVPTKRVISQINARQNGKSRVEKLPELQRQRYLEKIEKLCTDCCTNPIEISNYKISDAVNELYRSVVRR